MSIPEMFSNAESTVSFCGKRLDPIAANKEMQKHQADCLAPGKRDKYIALANEGKYNQVLGAIWKDKTNRLDFVRILANKLHAPIMFEAAILEFSANPTAKTAREVSLPLLCAAAIRVNQDAQCAVDPSVVNGDASKRMMRIYKTSFENRIRKELEDPASELFQKYPSVVALLKEDVASIKQKTKEFVLRVAQTSKEIDLPPPEWIGQSGMGVFIRQLDPNHPIMHPVSKHKELRDAFADLALKHGRA